MRLVLVLCFLSIVVLVSLPSAASENTFPVRISEVQMNPDGSDTGAEFVELVNVTMEIQNIGGWDLDAADLPYFTIPADTKIAPLSTLTIYFRKDGVNTPEQIFTGATFGSTNMKNTNGGIALFQSQTHTSLMLMDYVAYGAIGQIHESAAIEKGLWQQGMYVSVAGTEGWSIMRTCQKNIEISCWNYAVATPGIATVQDIIENNQNSNLENNENSSSGALIPSVSVFTNGVLFEENTLISEIPVYLEIQISSGAVLHIDSGQGFKEVFTEKYTIPLEEEGVYAFSYFLNNDEDSLKTLSITYSKPEPMLFPFINEISFNASDGKKDFLEIYFPPSGTSFSTLQGFSLLIDQTNILLDDVPVNADGYALVAFGGIRAEIDSAIQKVTMSPSSLVATTEQITLLYQNNPVDGICWESLPIASTESTDYTNFTGVNGIWNAACIEAKNVTAGKSVVRKERGNYPSERLMKELWEIIPLETPGSANILPHSAPNAQIQIQGDGRSNGTVPFSLNLTGESSNDAYGIASYEWDYGDGTKSNEINPPNHVYTLPGNYNVTLTIFNVLGDSTTKNIAITVTQAPSRGSSNETIPVTNNGCSSAGETQVILSELFPNPKGTDTGAEWIELYNPTDEQITFCNLWLDDEEGGSTPFSLKGKQVAPQGYLVLPDSETKLVLGNINDSVRLLYGVEKEILDSVSYQDAREGMGYSRL